MDLIPFVLLVMLIISFLFGIAGMTALWCLVGLESRVKRLEHEMAMDFDERGKTL